MQENNPLDLAPFIGRLDTATSQAIFEQDPPNYQVVEALINRLSEPIKRMSQTTGQEITESQQAQSLVLTDVEAVALRRILSIVNQIVEGLIAKGLA